MASGSIGVSEIVLSGGEPTLHPQLAEIAQHCKASGAWVSINTHAGHPTKLAAALPWLDELKIHVDSFDPSRQRASMGINIAKVRQSIDLAKGFGHPRLLLNHPLHSLTEAGEVIATARALAVDVKLIELLDTACGQPRLQQLPWAELGYCLANDGSWRHGDSGHRVLTRRCIPDAGLSLFVAPEGIRRDLATPILGRAETFSLAMLPAEAQPIKQAAASVSTPIIAQRLIERTRRYWEEH